MVEIWLIYGLLLCRGEAITGSGVDQEAEILLRGARGEKRGPGSSDFPEADYDDCFPSGPFNNV